jgi:hypothetical protein
LTRGAGQKADDLFRRFGARPSRQITFEKRMMDLSPLGVICGCSAAALNAGSFLSSVPSSQATRKGFNSFCVLAAYCNSSKFLDLAERVSSHITA